MIEAFAAILAVSLACYCAALCAIGWTLLVIAEGLIE